MALYRTAEMIELVHINPNPSSYVQMSCWCGAPNRGAPIKICVNAILSEGSKNAAFPRINDLISSD